MTLNYFREKFALFLFLGHSASHFRFSFKCNVGIGHPVNISKRFMQVLYLSYSLRKQCKDYLHVDGCAASAYSNRELIGSFPDGQSQQI